MANLTETATYDAAVPQLETTTLAAGGASGAMNSQAKALANRTKFIKAILDSPSALAALVQDASESVKGVVQYAATGVPSATKVPKATGAEIAALLTAGGYTLTAPSGANSLDGIADSETWKKVAAAVATALNAGTFDAATCKAFGIGSASLPQMDTSADNYKSGGLLRAAPGITNTPWYGYGATVLVAPYEEALVNQLAIGLGAYANHLKIRNFETTWKDWVEVWTASSDGNGGQPPAPKPALGAPAGGANGPGQFIPINQDSAYTAPGLGSTYWMGIIICHTTATGAIVAANSGAGMWAGGTIFTCAAGQTIQGFIWRQL